MRRLDLDHWPIGAGGGARLGPGLTTTDRGRDAEERACAHLVTFGYTVVLRNVRRGAGEIDIVAYDQETLCFVEVKWRSGTAYGGAGAAVTPRKQKRLRRAAAVFVAPMAPKPRCRFDVVLIQSGHAPTLIKGAFR